MRKWISLIGIVVSTGVVGQSLPVGVSPQMLNALKDMPPAQQAALARQYGITLPAGQDTQVSETLGAAGVPLLQSEIPVPATDKDPTIKQTEEVSEKASVRFGRDLFNRQVSTFAPTDDAPVRDTYRLGVGDELIVQLFGKENDQLVLQVGRGGDVLFPKLGSINLAGLTFEDARNLIKTRVEQQFIGVDALISMGRLRAIGIFMAGEVAVPGAYSVSALATVTQALFQAGGVSDIGSLRNIQVRRQGEIVATFDAYELLMQGDASGDIRLQSGDVLFVPPYAAIAEVQGEVKRPMVYELKGLETVEDLLRMAGYFTQQAFPSLAVLTRLSDVGGLPIAMNMDLSNPSVLGLKVSNGDVLRVPKAGKQVARSVTLEGAVNRPGDYGWAPGLRVSDLISDARSDLRLDADLSYSVIVSYKSALLDIQVDQFSLADAISRPGSDADPILKEFDRILVFSLPKSEPNGISKTVQRTELLAPIIEKLRAQAKEDEPEAVVSISGAVRAPGSYPLLEGMLLADLLEAAGGLKDSAFTSEAELRRLTQSKGKVLPDYRSVNLEQALNEKSKYTLQSRDHLMVREIPDWSPEDAIELRGEVAFPGRYLIQKGERLSDVIERAGGFTAEAFPEGAIFTREEVAKKEAERARRFAEDIRQTFATRLLTQETTTGSLQDVSSITQALEGFEGRGRLLVDLPAAVMGDGAADIEVTDGDVLTIPKFNRSVTVVGEVQQSGSHIYQAQYSLQDYLGLSAGLTDRANDKAIYVIRANGSVRMLDKSWWRFVGASVSIQPGDTIVVPVNTQYQETLASWREITQIVYQSIVSVAAVARL